jgi:hypothetical protein
VFFHFIAVSDYVISMQQNKKLLTNAQLFKGYFLFIGGMVCSTQNMDSSKQREKEGD